MSGYQLETVEGKRARFWGGGAALGGLVLTLIVGLGAANAASEVNLDCGRFADTKVCAVDHAQETAWLRLLEYSGALAVAGGISYLGADVLDRKLVVRRYSEHIELESSAAWTSDLQRYTDALPEAPPDIVPPNSGTAESEEI